MVNFLKKGLWLKVSIALVVVLCLVFGMFYYSGHYYRGATILAKADEPKSISQKTLMDKYINSVQNIGLSVLLNSKNKEPNTNQLISPLSLSMGLSMVMSGASGNTFDELKSVLGYSDMTMDDIYAQNKAAYEKSYLTDKDLKLRISNAIWFDKNYGIKDTFLDSCKTNFFADIFAQDFNKTDSLLASVNCWVNDKSNGKIKSIIDKVGANDIMYLINSVYFEGKWENPFDKSKTKAGDFFLADKSTVQADFMYSKEQVQYKGTESFDAVSIPYKGGMHMVVALPSEGKSTSEMLADKALMGNILDFNNWTYEGALTDESGEKYPEYRTANIIMPKFEFEKETDLIPILQDLGVKDAFSDSANFSKMANDLYIGMAKQKTFISVDEEKTIAISFNFTGMKTKSAMQTSKEVIFNRPFIFSIVDNEGLPLFIGVIENPLLNK